MSSPKRKPILGDYEARPYDRADGYEEFLGAQCSPRHDDGSSPDPQTGVHVGDRDASGSSVGDREG